MVQMKNNDTCTWCGLVTEKIEGPTHEYLAATPGCWAKFGEILAREYENFEYMAVHNLTADAYALQHPGVEEPRTVSSANVHLVSLYAYFEKNIPVHELSQIKQKITKYKNEFVWLAPPDFLTQIKISDVLAASNPEEYKEIIHKWAKYVFDGWGEHHKAANKLLGKII